MLEWKRKLFSQRYRADDGGDGGGDSGGSSSSGSDNTGGFGTSNGFSGLGGFGGLGGFTGGYTGGGFGGTGSGTTGGAGATPGFGFDAFGAPATTDYTSPAMTSPSVTGSFGFDPSLASSTMSPGISQTPGIGALANYGTINSTPSAADYSYGTNPNMGFAGTFNNMSGLMGIQNNPTATGWGDLGNPSTDPTKAPAYRYSAPPSTSEISSQLAAQYQASPMRQLGSFFSNVAPAAAFAGPGIGGLSSLVGTGLNTYARNYYGQNPSGAPIGATAGGMIGSQLGGPLGGIAGRTLGGVLGGMATGDQNVGQTTGQNLAGSIAGNAIGNVTSGMGPAGGLVGSLLGRGLSSAMSGSTGEANPGGTNTGSSGFLNTLGQVAGGLAPLARAYMQYNMTKGAAQQQRDLSQQMLQRADPFGTQRAQYGTQLQQMMQNPQQVIQNNPILSAAYNQQLEQANRAMAASGNLGSGARVAALAQQAPAFLGPIYNQEANRLAQLAGSNISSPYAIQNALGMQGVSNDYDRLAKMRLINSMFGDTSAYG